MSQYFDVPDAGLEGPPPPWPLRRTGPRLGNCLVVGSEPDGVVEALLRTAGFCTSSSESGEDALARIELAPPDFVVLDLAVHLGTEVSTCRAIRSRYEAPIMVLSDANGDDIVELFRAGADAYLSRPIRHHELVARARALLRRRPPLIQDGPQDHVEEIWVDRAAGRATVAGRALDLSTREFEVLATLVADCGSRVTRRDALLNANERPHSIDTVIRRVRTLLEVEEGWRRLVSVRGVGFRLMRNPRDL